MPRTMSAVVWVAHTHWYGYACVMKTTLDLSDELLARAKRHAKRTGKPLRAIVEEGLRLALGVEAAARPYRLPDRRTGHPGDPNPLEGLSWQDLRHEIYGGR